MNSGMPEDSSFEAELRQLRPTSVRKETLERWEASCEVATEQKAEPFVRETRQWTWLLAALVLLTGFMGVLAVGHFWDNVDQLPQSPATHSSVDHDPGLKGGLKKVADFQPESVERYFVSASDDGVVTSVGNVPFRRVRYELMDTFYWENPQDGSRLQMMIPRQEVLLLPVVTY